MIYAYMQGIILQPTLWERKKFLPAIIAYTLAVIAYTLGLKILLSSQHCILRNADTTVLCIQLRSFV